tara:strand:- start:1146 stop:1481 length:336 start_codon:yes stop_codon:yes gene_type:complete
MAGTHNIQIDQGSDFALDLTVTESGSAKNLTGYSARAQIRSTKAASSASAAFTCSVVSAAAGTLKMELANATSSGLSAGQYFYDLEIFTSGNVIVQRLIEGTVTINQEVTR